MLFQRRFSEKSRRKEVPAFDGEEVSYFGEVARITVVAGH